MTAPIGEFLFASIYIFVLCYALVSDFGRLIIPNWCSIALVLAFIPFAAIYLSATEAGLHVLVSLLVLALGFGFYVLAWFGAGDVKLLSAVMLWVGVSEATHFVLLMALFGFVLAFALILLRRLLQLYPDLDSRRSVMRRPAAWVEQGAFPYGIAICGAGLAYVPSIFLR